LAGKRWIIRWASGNWPLVAPSPLPYLPELSQAPVEMTRTDMDKVRADFVRATRLGLQAEFDMLELHMAHGYLLASFLSPLTNNRRDQFGGTIRGRLRYPLEVLEAVRAEWPAHKPLSVRISATDWADGGFSEEDLLTITRAFKDAGVDLIDVSTGQTVPWQKPVYGRMWQTPFADKVRNEIGIATMAVGNIYDPDHVNSIIASGRADLCAIARSAPGESRMDARGPPRGLGITHSGGRSSTSQGRANSNATCSVPLKPAEASDHERTARNIRRSARCRHPARAAASAAQSSRHWRPRAHACLSSDGTKAGSRKSRASWAEQAEPIPLPSMSPR